MAPHDNHRYASAYIGALAKAFGEDDFDGSAASLVAQLKSLTAADLDADGFFSRKASKLVSAWSGKQDAKRKAAEREGIRAAFGATWNLEGRDLDREIAAAHRNAQAVLRATRVAMGACDAKDSKPAPAAKKVDPASSQSETVQAIIAADRRARGESI